VIGWLIFLLLHGYLLYNKGQTIGKALVKTRIIDRPGNIPNIGRVLGLRYFALSLLTAIPVVGGCVGLADVIYIFGEERRCIHDYLADTWVVNV